MELKMLWASLLLLFGIILVYDARSISKREFGFGDQNQATGGLKILGTILSILGGLAIFFIA